MASSRGPAIRLRAGRGRLVCLLRLPRLLGPRRLVFILRPAAPRLRRLELLPGGGSRPPEAA